MLNSVQATTQGAAAPPFKPSVELESIKAKQRATWASGNYGVIGTTLQIVGESLCEAVDLRAGSKVLDVAAGNGNCSLAAARRWCDVTSTDYVPALLEAGRRRADAEGLHVSLPGADAEALPFGDDTFDAVLSSFGVMFAPDHARAASELLRVCRAQGPHRPGELDAARVRGRSCSGSWAATSRRRPALTPPARWGTRRPPERAVWSRCGRHPCHAARLRVPLPLARPLDRGLPHVVRPGAQGVRRLSEDGRPNSRQTSSPHRPLQHQRGRDDGRAERSTRKW